MFSSSVQDFYDKEAVSWDKSRQHSWAGLEAIFANESGIDELKKIAQAQSVLELGCGNGRLMSAHARQLTSMRKYTGVDISAGLLAIAQENINAALAGKAAGEAELGGRDAELGIGDARPEPEINLLRADLTAEGWSSVLPAGQKSEGYDLIIMVATLHHIPPRLAPQLFSEIAGLLERGGLLIFSSWQFLPELSHLVLSGEQLAAHLKSRELPLGEGDYLLSWQKSGNYRYAHQYSSQEVSDLLKDLPLRLVHRFTADGRSQKLNYYYILQRS